MLPIIEYSGATLTGLVQQLALVELCSDFELTADGGGFHGNRSYPSLNPTFLEPERLPIVEVAGKVSHSSIQSKVPKDRLFSVAELKRDIELIELAYAEFDLRQTGFGQMAGLVTALALYSHDDFSISISQHDFQDLAAAHGLSDAARDKLIFKGKTYLEALNTYAPLVRISSVELHTTVTLLSRFLYYWKNFCLYRNRRFQIRSGFEFEKHVRQELEAQGYQLTAVKRIKRKEFDVVAVRDGVVFNVQCKNNLVDPEWVDSEPARFARVNRNLAKSYERALIKERNREHLLLKELGLSRIENFVVSRFPIVSDNPRIIPGTLLHQFRELAELAAR